MNHMMIDIETLDTANSAVVTRVGWCLFDHDRISPGQEVIMDIQEQIDMGRTISASTLRFWMEQPDIARQRVFCNDNPLSVNDLATQLRMVIGTSKIDCVWSHGPHFDMAILKDLLGDGVFHYRSPRDTRTMSMLAPHIAKPAAVTKHSAGDDSFAQAQWMQLVWEEIGFPHGYNSGEIT